MTSVLLASLAVFSWKFLGYLVPARYVSGPNFRRIADSITVGLLASLVGIQGFTVSSDIVVDSRLPALILAGFLLYLKMPFIVVIASAATLSALVRLLI